MAKTGCLPPALVPTRVLAQVYSMAQVLTLLGLSVADPLRGAVAVLNIDVPSMFIHFECHGIKHSYYAGWLVTAPISHSRSSAPPVRTAGGSAPSPSKLSQASRSC